MRRKATRFGSVLLVLVVLPTSFAAQKNYEDKATGDIVDRPAVIWRDPGDIASLNLFYGAGGKGHAPAHRGILRCPVQDPSGGQGHFAECLSRRGNPDCGVEQVTLKTHRSEC